MHKSNRLLSFIIVSIIYILAITLGIFLAFILPFDLWLNILLADISSTILIFIFSLIFKNASIYDPYWSVQPMVISLTLFISYQNFSIINILLLVVILIWGIRLTANWAYTFTNLTYEDWRYVMLKEKTKKFYPIINFIGIHLVPTLVVYSCCLPIIFTFSISDSKLDVVNVIFVVLALFSVILQSAADVTMHIYRKDKKAGKETSNFIRRGVWKYSRHPNYLAEITFWWSIAFAVIFTSYNLWFVFVGALINTMLFIFVSIPMAENKQKKKEGYDLYKKETFSLLPIKKIK